MNEKRFKLSDWCGEQNVSNVIDIEKQTHLINIKVVDLLNEQQATISRLEEENEQLKEENNMLKITIDRNESYIRRLTHQSDWHC